jgi:hypothetical protein
VKNLNFLSRPGIPRDERGWANFAFLDELRGIFTDAEILTMCNHYLVSKAQWEPEYEAWKKRQRENNRKQEEAAAARRAAKPVLKANVPLRQQLQRPR